MGGGVESLQGLVLLEGAMTRKYMTCLKVTNSPESLYDHYVPKCYNVIKHSENMI